MLGILPALGAEPAADIAGDDPDSWGIYETTRRKAEAVLQEGAAAVVEGRPKSEYAPGSMEYQALHPDWKPQED